MRNIRFEPLYFAVAIIVLVLEILVASVLAKVPFIRGSVSDFFATVFVYFVVLAFFRLRHSWLALGVFLFAGLIEAGQYFHFSDRIGLSRGSLLSVLLGNTFSWSDILLYALGAYAAWLFGSHVLKEKFVASVSRVDSCD